MSNPGQIEEARATIKQQCDILNISCIVSIDNQNATGTGIEDIVVAAIKIEPTVLQSIFPELGDTIPEDSDVLKNKIKEKWGELDKKVQNERAEKILATARLKDASVSNDPGDAAVLRDLIPDNLLALSLKQWNEQKDKLLQESPGALFLIDQDFSEEGGGGKDGITIIASLLAGKDREKVICCLLTHTVLPDNQYEEWGKLAQDYGLPQDRFLVISKQYLSKDPIFFAQMLKLVALIPDFSLLKEKAKGIIGQAADVANKEVDKIKIYDLEHIVFRVAAEEGLWEPDMLFRLYNMFHRLEARQLVYKDVDLLKIINRMRAVSEIPTNGSPRSSIWELQNKELYESSDYVNKNYLPLDLGDIFKKTDSQSKKFYILIGQPCDLMVRSKGERTPKQDYLTLVEIVPVDDALKLYCEELKCFGTKQSERWGIMFKRAHQIPTHILDFCVLNNDGISRLQRGGTPPDTLRPAWKTRYPILVKVLEDLLTKIDILLPKTGDSADIQGFKDTIARGQIIDSFIPDSLFKGTIDATRGMVSFNCQRVARLSRVRAFGLLMAYTSCLSRPAYDPDFVK